MSEDISVFIPPCSLDRHTFLIWCPDIGEAEDDAKSIIAYQIPQAVDLWANQYLTLSSFTDLRVNVMIPDGGTATLFLNKEK